jgi:transposase
MAILDQIGQDKQRISERLMRLDVERTKLSDQLNELEIAERALNRFDKKGAEPRARGSQQARGASLGEATLKAVQAHAKGASADEVLKYLSRKFGLAVRPNHLGSALQRHRRAGRLENRDLRWHVPPLS